MTPAEIEQHGKNVRRRVNRIYEDSAYKNFGPVKDLFAVADDLCELITALAQEVQRLERLIVGPEQAKETENG